MYFSPQIVGGSHYDLHFPGFSRLAQPRKRSNFTFSLFICSRRLCLRYGAMFDNLPFPLAIAFHHYLFPPFFLTSLSLYAFLSYPPSFRSSSSSPFSLLDCQMESWMEFPILVSAQFASHKSLLRLFPCLYRFSSFLLHFTYKPSCVHMSKTHGSPTMQDMRAHIAPFADAQHGPENLM